MRKLLVILVICGAFAGCDENIEAHYASYAELQQADAGARSWMPEWLPPTATDIRDWHNLDTNHTLIAFTVENATPAILGGCRSVVKVSNPGEPSEWWPDDQVFASLQHFKCEERVTYADGRVETRAVGAAIDSRRNRVYFWR